MPRSRPQRQNLNAGAVLYVLTNQIKNAIAVFRRTPEPMDSRSARKVLPQNSEASAICLG
jgi:hypothetical protein